MHALCEARRLVGYVDYVMIVVARGGAREPAPLAKLWGPWTSTKHVRYIFVSFNVHFISLYVLNVLVCFVIKKTCYVLNYYLKSPKQNKTAENDTLPTLDFKNISRGNILRTP